MDQLRSDGDALTCGHDHRADNHQCTIVPLQRGQKPKHNEGARQDAESNRQASDADAYRVLTIHIERLSRPEQQHGEEVGATDERDDERKPQYPRRLLQSRRKHGIFCPFPFPDEKCHKQEEAGEQRREYMGGRPGILVAAPLQAGHEDQHATDTQEASNEVDLLEDLRARQTHRVDSGWWEVKDQGHDETDSSPGSTKGATIAPAGMSGNELSPQY